MPVTKTLLSDTCPPQINEVLDRFQLVPLDSYDDDGRRDLLRNSAIFQSHFRDVSFEDITVVSDKKGKFVDLGCPKLSIKGIFLYEGQGIQYPCRVCAKEVTDKLDNSGLGLKCNGCDMFFHNSCTPEPMSAKLFNELATSPSWVKVLCPSCHLVLGSVDHKLQTVSKEISTLKSAVKDMGDKVKRVKQYSEVVKTGSPAAPILTKKVISGLTELSKGAVEKNESERLKRTRIILKPGNTQIRSSRDIRREFNQHYKGLIIKHCRVTASGSIMFEFEDEDTAKKVETGWSTSYFGTNVGIRCPSESNSCGIIRHIVDDVEEAKIKADINSAFPGATSQLFTRKSDGRFLGTVKVQFGSRTDLLKAMNDKITIGQQQFRVDEFIRKPRVIKCNKCQGWGHIQRYCSRNPKCGKCTENHETSSCSVVTDFKCCHCQGNHRTGDPRCKIYKEKMARFGTSHHG